MSENFTTTSNLNVSCDICSLGNDTAIDKPIPSIITALERFNYGYLPFVFILGCLGNALTIFVMRSKKFSSNTCSLAILALALSDTTLLFCQPFNKAFFIKLVGIDVRSLSSVGCKIYYVIRRTPKMCSSWFIVYLCFEKFMSIWFPLKVKSLITKRFVNAYIIIVVVVLLAFTSGWSYASDVDPVSGKCQPDLYDRKDPQSVSTWRRMLGSGVTLYAIVPMIILLIFTPMILFKLARQGQKFESSAYLKKSSRITAMLLLIVISYIILILPISLVHILATYLGIKSFGDSKLDFTIFKEIAQILEQLNYSINFILYFLSSSHFREGLREICCPSKTNMNLGPKGTVDKSKRRFQLSSKSSNQE
ncbi:hypothetical protein FSP39_002836 [Pinctada imbricata]|uniref:G-protein coupled receptors family 1 profile domain-containing protein n=1 Tax=Pinctada imbricata TaxID=66713 RepID=A0AA88XV71_PINIB|nr:hypothetical protein FSP39_002836 [Pinctada imbricata]